VHTIGSVCTGYGGLDDGVRDVLDGRLAWVADPDPDAARILAHNHPDVPNLGSIVACFPNWVELLEALDQLDRIPRALITNRERERRRQHLLDYAGDLAEHGPDCMWNHVDPVDVLAAGFPCQPWSDAGARRGASDPRDLWSAVAHAVGVLRPRLLVLENVAGFARLRAGAGRTIADLADLGYDTRWQLVEAATVGAPHRRRRWFCLGWDRAAADAAADRLSAGTRNRTSGRQPDSQHHDGLTLTDAVWLMQAPLASLANGVQVLERQVGGRGSDDLLLPTPKARDWKGTGPASLDRKSPDLNAVLLPTPTAKLGDARRGSPSAALAADRIAGGRRNLDDAAALLPTPRATDGTKGGPNQHGSSGDLMLPSAVQPGRWGRWAAAVARWEAVFGRPAPDPTEPRPATMKSIRACADEWGVDGWAAREAILAGWWGARLAPPFVEWMMGVPAGHVTAVPGVSRSAQLARLGNGVVPQQAAVAVRILLPELAALQADPDQGDVWADILGKVVAS
jgi:DNA (cytosine-5)-methyltransferase 1